ncbi:MAG: transglutaminase family protein [Bryobacteraceae bacterium]
MRIQVHHATQYLYDSPVFLEPHTFRLRPRDDGAQRLLSHRLEIWPAPAGRSDCLDQDGNVAVEAWFDRKLTEWRIESEFEIETLRENPFDFVATAGMLALAPVYPEAVAASLAPYRELAQPSPAIRQFAASAAAAAGGHTLEFLTVLNRRLFEAFGHEVRDSGPPHPPEVTLGLKSGTCRDLVVLFAAAARAVGIPTRFVSGYEAGAAEQEKPDLHAWAEVYLQGGGWRGYDPAAGLATSTRHIAVAAAADPRLAAPITGTYRGSARSEMRFSLTMQLDPGAQPDTANSQAASAP